MSVFDEAVKNVHRERSLEGMWLAFSKLLDCQVTQLSRTDSWNITLEDQIFAYQMNLIAS